MRNAIVAGRMWSERGAKSRAQVVFAGEEAHHAQHTDGEPLTFILGEGEGVEEGRSRMVSRTQLPSANICLTAFKNWYLKQRVEFF